MTDAHQQKAIFARYLVSYDWPLVADTAEILARLRGIVGQLGNVELPVSATVHGKKKPINTDLFKIKDLSIIEAVETIEEHGIAVGLSGLFYSYSKRLDMAVLSIAIPSYKLQPGLIESMIRALHEVDGIGYTIAFDDILGRKQCTTRLASPLAKSRLTTRRCLRASLEGSSSRGHARA